MDFFISNWHISISIFHKKKSYRRTSSFGSEELIDSSIISSSILLSIPQIYQIQYNSAIILEDNLFDLFILIFPFIILLICLFFLILAIISLVISLDEYKSYVRKKSIEPTTKFRNLSFEDIFENENRRRIIKLILSEPGIHFNDLKRKSALNSGQFQWHLNIMLEYRIIKKNKIDNNSIFIPNINNLSFEKYSRKYIKSKTSLDVLNMIENQPGIIPSLIAKELNLRKSTITYHINKLKRRSLIESIKEGRELKIFAIRE